MGIRCTFYGDVSLSFTYSSNLNYCACALLSALFIVIAPGASVMLEKYPKSKLEAYVV